MTRVYAKAFALWCLVLMLAVANGLLREAVLMPALGAVPGMVLSGVLLSLAVLLTAVVGVRWWGRLVSRQSLMVGGFWLVLTLAFEISFGRCVRGLSWPEVFAAYRFAGGNIWSLVLLCVLMAPWLAERLRCSR